MSKTEDIEKADVETTIDLKDPVLAAFLAWMLPGLGHLYQKRFAKSVLFFVCIIGTFLFGLYLGSSNAVVKGQKIGWGRVVYWSWRNQHGTTQKRWHYFCQVGVGLPAMPAILQSMRMRDGKQVLWDGFMAPPRIAPPTEAERLADPNNGQPTLSLLNDELNRYFELGTVFTMIAGLLNILAIYDAWGGPVFGEAPKDGTSTSEEDEEEDDPDQSGRDETKPDDAS